MAMTCTGVICVLEKGLFMMTFLLMPIVVGICAIQYKYHEKLNEETIAIQNANKYMDEFVTIIKTVSEYLLPLLSSLDSRRNRATEQPMYHPASEHDDTNDPIHMNPPTETQPTPT